MKIFIPVGENGFELTHPVDPQDFDTINKEVNGSPHNGRWKPLRMKLIRTDDRGKPRMESDAPWLGSHALILKHSAAQKISPLLHDRAELLPVECDETELVIVNPTRLIDALDEESSSIRRFAPSGRIWRVDKYVFLPDRVRDARFFKISSLKVSPTFVDEDFIAEWSGRGFRGLRFEPVWSG